MLDFIFGRNFATIIIKLKVENFSFNKTFDYNREKCKIYIFFPTNLNNIINLIMNFIDCKNINKLLLYAMIMETNAIIIKLLLLTYRYSL